MTVKRNRIHEIKQRMRISDFILDLIAKDPQITQLEIADRLNGSCIRTLRNKSWTNANVARFIDQMEYCESEVKLQKNFRRESVNRLLKMAKKQIFDGESHRRAMATVDNLTAQGV